MMVMKANVNIELNATDILAKLWPTMLFSIVLIIIIGIGGLVYTGGMTNEIHRIIAFYVWLFSALTIYFGSVRLFFADIKKMAQESLPSHRSE